MEPYSHVLHGSVRSVELLQVKCIIVIQFKENLSPCRIGTTTSIIETGKYDLQNSAFEVHIQNAKETPQSFSLAGSGCHRLFNNQMTYMTNDGPFVITSADFNNDSIIDLAVSNYADKNLFHFYFSSLRRVLFGLQWNVNFFAFALDEISLEDRCALYWFSEIKKICSS